ncbi:hypothetical protein AZZ66_003713, partial [Escherichia coli]
DRLGDFDARAERCGGRQRRAPATGRSEKPPDKCGKQRRYRRGEEYVYRRRAGAERVCAQGGYQTDCQ